MFRASLSLCLLASASGAVPAGNETHTILLTGRLDQEDPTLQSGEYVDVHMVKVSRRGEVTVTLDSDFDGYLIVQPPDFAETREGQVENDDWEGDLTRSRVVIPDAGTGSWRIAVTTANKGVGGNYRLTVDLPGPDPSRVRMRRERGKLSKDDPTLSSGEHFDRYEVELQAGERLVATMESSAFDTYLGLLSPDGESLSQNDDFEGSTARSRIDHVAAVAGKYTLVATSAPGGVVGPYELTIEQIRPGEAAADAPELVRGELAEGDTTLDSGNFVDIYSRKAQPGTRLTVDLTSPSFDTVLFATTASGDLLEMNDDFEGNAALSRVTFEVPSDGRYSLAVSSYTKATGPYELSISSAEPAAAPVAAAAPTSAETTRTAGRLESGDQTLSSGEFTDVHPLDLAAGETVTLLLESSEFDAFLVLVRDDGDPIQVDDSDGSTNPRLEYTAPAAGKVSVIVTSARPGESGAYTLSITRGAAAETTPEPDILMGELDGGDGRLASGEFMEIHEFPMTAGVTYLCSMSSTEFNAYLGISSPSGETVEDDDGGADGNAFLMYTAEESGMHRLTATSAKPGETGTYVIVIAPLDLGDDEAPAAQASEPAADVLVVGRPASGRLEEGDAVLDNGEYRDTWLFEATQGQSFSFEVASDEFDTYLILIDSEENILQNDDLEGARNKSGIDWIAPSDGPVAVVVTSYRRGESGSYSLSVTPASAAASTTTSGRVYGVFVGISDYPGEDSDLPLCDTDAVRLQTALTEHAGMAAEDSVVLINREAQGARVREAIRDISSRVREGDTFVFFYSGHGSRVKRERLVEHDPDGHDALDEALVLYDGLLLDDELDALLTDVRQGTTLVILDSCFSGGFSKDVISRPNRMGLFSSHEDVTSATAAKFKAGGFLAAFAADAISRDHSIADENGDGFLSASELSQYIYEGYRNELVRAKSADFLDVSNNLGYQQLIVDRGGVGVQHQLFRVR